MLIDAWRASIAEVFEVPAKALAGRTRRLDAVEARHALWWLLANEAGLTMAEIARLDGRDHTTICHAMARFAMRAAEDPTLTRRTALALALAQPEPPSAVERDVVVIEALTVLRDPPEQVAKVLGMTLAEVMGVASRFGVERSAKPEAIVF